MITCAVFKGAMGGVTAVQVSRLAHLMTGAGSPQDAHHDKAVGQCSFELLYLREFWSDFIEIIFLILTASKINSPMQKF